MAGPSIPRRKRSTPTALIAPAATAVDRVLFDSSLVAVLLTAPDGRILAANGAACRLFQRSEAELRRLGRDAVVDATDPRLAEALARRERTGGFAGELRLRRKDGTTFPAEVFSRVFVDRDGQPRSSMLILDVSPRLEAEAELRAERARLREIFAQAPAFFCVLRGPAHVFELANPAYLALVGHRDVLGKPVREALPEVEGQGFFELLDRVYRTGEPVTLTDAPVRLREGPDGALAERAVSFVYQPLREADGTVSGIIAHGIDVTDRVRAEEERRASEERYRTLVQRIDQGYCRFEMLYGADGRPHDYRFLEVNPTFERHTGLKDAVGKTARELVPGLEEHWVEVYGRVAATGEPHRFAQGSAAMGRWFEVEAVRVGGAGSRQVALLFADVTERRQTEAALHEAEARFRGLFAGVADAILVADEAGRYLDANPAAEALLGYHRDELLALRVADVVAKAPAWTEAEYARYRAEGTWRGELELRRKDGSTVPVEALATVVTLPTGPMYLSAVRDMTERKRAEAAL